MRDRDSPRRSPALCRKTMALRSTDGFERAPIYPMALPLLRDRRDTDQLLRRVIPLLTHHPQRPSRHRLRSGVPPHRCLGADLYDGRGLLSGILLRHAPPTAPSAISIGCNFLRIPLALALLHFFGGIACLWWTICITCILKGTLAGGYYLLKGRARIYPPTEEPTERIPMGG